MKSFFKNKYVKYFLITFFSLFFISTCIIGIKLYSIARKLPQAEEIANYRFIQPSIVYDRTGNVVAELGTEKRYPISIDEMPLYLKQAVIATEDKRFYEHGGIDISGILRAMYKNIRAGKFSEGGSTLTQQLMKNIYLTPEKKFIRKYMEAVLAYRVDHYLTKDEILEFYLNYVNFGRGGYGVQSAAINYFGKDAKDLTLAECALLAGIPKAPGRYSPHNNMTRAKHRRNIVLLRMYEVGYITEQQYLETIEEPVVITKTTPQRLRHAAYFLDYVLKFLSEELQIKDAQNQGLKVYTTLNIDFQEIAENAVKLKVIENAKRIGYFGAKDKISREDLEEQEVISDTDDAVIKPAIDELLQVPKYLELIGYKKGIIASVNNQQADVVFTASDYKDYSIAKNQAIQTGQILLKDNRWAKPAYSQKRLSDLRTILSIGDIIYYREKADNSSQLLLEQDPPMEASLLAIDPETGEIIAMVGGVAFEKSMFNRAVQAKRQVGSAFKPIIYSVAFEEGMQPMDKILDAPILTQPDEKGDVWRPKNYVDRYYGETTLKDGVTRSRNIVTIKVAEKINVRTIIKYSRLFGITSDMPADLSLALGSASISLLEMVYAYSVFPNMGSKVTAPYFVTKVEDANGEIIYEAQPPETVNVISPATSQMMTDMLINVVENGTGFRAKFIPRPLGAKTGTSNDNKDAWFIGFIPNLTVGVWTGFDDPEDVGTGSQAAGPIWVDFMSKVYHKVKPGIFPVAEGVIYKKVDTATWEETDELKEDISFEPFSYYVVNDEVTTIGLDENVVFFNSLGEQTATDEMR